MRRDKKEMLICQKIGQDSKTNGGFTFFDVPGCGRNKCTVIDRFHLLSMVLVDSSYDFGIPKFRVSEWATMIAWANQFSNNTGVTPEFILNLYKEPRPHVRIKLILGIPGIRKRMYRDGREILAVCCLPEKNRKDKDKAKGHMLSGMRYMKDDNFSAALDEFNKGLVYSHQPSSVQLSLENNLEISNLYPMCLAHRIKAYRGMGKIKEAYLDFCDAIKLQVSDKFIHTLIVSHKDIADVCDKLKSERKFDWVSIPESDYFGMKQAIRNKDLIGAHKALKICFKSKLFRGIETTEDIKPKTLLVCESPVATWLSPRYYDTHCAHCLKKIDNRPFPCRKCIYVNYCSVRCSDNAWYDYHFRECKFIPILQFIPLGQAVLRTVLTIGIQESLEAYATYIDNRSKFKESEQKTFSKNLLDILTMRSHEHSLDTGTTGICFTAAFLAMLAVSVGLIRSASIHQLGGLFFKLMTIFRTNALFITDDGLTISEPGYFSVKPKRRVIGACLYATSSLINHDCNSNCYASFIGNRLLVISTRGIKSGKEITLNYLGFKERSDPNRREILLSRYQFVCQCVTCVSENNRRGKDNKSLKTAPVTRIDPEIVKTDVELNISDVTNEPESIPKSFDPAREFKPGSEPLVDLDVIEPSEQQLSFINGFSSNIRKEQESKPLTFPELHYPLGTVKPASGRKSTPNTQKIKNIRLTVPETESELKPSQKPKSKGANNRRGGKGKKGKKSNRRPKHW